MSARALLSLVESLLVENGGREQLEEIYANAETDEVAARRRENAIAAAMVGGEVTYA